MLYSLSPLKIWGSALALFALDYVLIMSFLGTGPKMPTDQSSWDFRIAELRSIDVKPQTAVAGLSVSRESKDAAVEENNKANSLYDIEFQTTIDSNDVTIYQLPF